MTDTTKSTAAVPETLEINSAATFPSLLLLKKPPIPVDKSTRVAQFKELQQNGTSVLDRIRNFLPRMQESETALQQQLLTISEPEKLDIEHVEEGSTAVEFNLALFEHSSSDTDETSSDSSSNSDTSDSDEEDPGKTISPPQKKPKILVCSDESETS